MPRRLKTEAIVLKRKELLNKDIVYTLLTAELGRVKATAKGVKSLTSKRSPHLQTGNLISVVLYKKEDFFYLQETDLKSGFSDIKKRAEKMSYLYFIFFVVDRLVPENQNEFEVFNLVKKFIIDLSKRKAINITILEKYLSLLLIKLGYINERGKIDELRSTIEGLINEKLSLFVI